MPILGRILNDTGLTGTQTGVIVVAAAAVNDVAGWIMLSAISVFSSAHRWGWSSAVHVGGIACLVATLLIAVHPAVDRLARLFPVRDGKISPNLMAVAIALMFALGLFTYELGIFAIFGGFLAGLLFQRQAGFTQAWRNQVGQFVTVFFLPIFFTYSGLRTNVLGLATWSDWAWCAMFALAAIASKTIPIYAASRLCGAAPDRAAVLAVLMNTRALMDLVVLNIGLDLGFIPAKVFSMLVLMAIATTIMTMPLLIVLARRARWSVHGREHPPIPGFAVHLPARSDC